jgi:hypothetical protein
MLETHLAGKATEKRQNFDSSIPPACAEHLHFRLNGEIRRALGHCQMQAPRQLGKTWTSIQLISTLPLPVFIFETFFVCFFVVFFCTSLFVFPFSFNFFAFHLFPPFHSKYHWCYYYKPQNA